MPLDHEDLLHLNAAHGFLNLGLPLDANYELEYITADCRHLPEVLSLRLPIYQKLEKWDLMEVVARRLVEYDESVVEWWLSLAYATRRMNSIPEAKTILKKAILVHPANAYVFYNLACYECQLGDLAKSKDLLVRAFELDPKCRLYALEDEDLTPLWTSM